MHLQFKDSFQLCDVIMAAIILDPRVEETSINKKNNVALT